ncbi:MAG: hypothetical protein SGJ13_15805 [Actinomycetota bacterium]|nr:hypothetical protein [Actinomycetota bacterium]
MTHRRPLLAAALALTLAACGGGGDSDDRSAAADNDATTPPTETTAPTNAPPGSASDTTAPVPVGESPLPEVEVRDVATGESLQLAALLPSDRPLLVWFWAPH